MPDPPLGIEAGAVKKAIEALAPMVHTLQGREDKQETVRVGDPWFSHEAKSFFSDLSFYRYLLNIDSVSGTGETEGPEWSGSALEELKVWGIHLQIKVICLNRRKGASVFWGHSADFAEVGNEVHGTQMRHNRNFKRTVCRVGDVLVTRSLTDFLCLRVPLMPRP